MFPLYCLYTPFVFTFYVLYFPIEFLYNYFRFNLYFLYISHAVCQFLTFAFTDDYGLFSIIPTGVTLEEYLGPVAVRALLALLLPRLVLGHREERALGLALGRLDDGRDELLQEAVDLEQRRPEVVHEVDEQPLDVRAVVVLVRHDHEVAVAQRLDIFLSVLRAGAEAQNFDDVLYLRCGTLVSRSARRRR